MASPLNFNGGLTLSFQVKDRTRSITWYRDVLGFELLYDVEDMGWCELASAVPGVNVGLSEVEEPKVGHGPVPTFGVIDIDVGHVMGRWVRPLEPQPDVEDVGPGEGPRRQRAVASGDVCFAVF